jgi:hypothetical protein
MAGMDREGGAFFANNRKTAPNMPDYRGEIRISADTLASLVAQAKSGVQFPAIELSGWKKQSSNGTVFISLAGKKPYVKDGQQAPQQQRQQPQQGGYSNSIPLDDEIPF